MNVRSILMIGVISASTLGVIGCDDDGTGLEAQDLRGTWVASVYEYTDNANAQNVTDIIQRDGASFALTVDASGGASTLLDDGLGTFWAWRRYCLSAGQIAHVASSPDCLGGQAGGTGVGNCARP